MFPSACSFIVLVFTVSLHVSAYMAIVRGTEYFIFICLKRQTTKTEQADKHTRKETTKITKENMQSVITWKKGKKSSEAESFKHMKIKHPTRLKMATAGDRVRAGSSHVFVVDEVALRQAFSEYFGYPYHSFHPLIHNHHHHHLSSEAGRVGQ
jgi:hypothetical protein